MALDVTLARGSCASFVQMPSPHHGVALLAQEMQGEVSVPWSEGMIAMGWFFFLESHQKCSEIFDGMW